MSVLRLNKLCELEDFSDPELTDVIRELEPDITASIPDNPAGHEHRKAWEFAQLIRAGNAFHVIRPDSLVLAVAAGSDRPIFSLTNRTRTVFATDQYGVTNPGMLTGAEHFALVPFNQRRLVVQHMEPTNLRFEDNTFDFVFSLNAFQRCGGLDGARSLLAGMARICRPGGIVAVSAECIINDVPGPSDPGIYLFSPQEITELTVSIPGLGLTEPVDFQLSDATRATLTRMEDAVRDLSLGIMKYPHVLLSIGQAQFTSVMLCFRKRY